MGVPPSGQLGVPWVLPIRTGWGTPPQLRVDGASLLGLDGVPPPPSELDGVPSPPLGLDGATPPIGTGWGTPPPPPNQKAAAERALATRQEVWLLRSRRKTFFSLIKL